MLPEAKLPASLDGERLLPHFLGESDYPWLRALLEEWDAYVGRRRRELVARLELPLACPSPPRKRALATAVLEKLCHVGSKRRRRDATSLVPAMVRSVAFTAAAKAPASLARDDVISRAAAELNASVADVEEALFADLPGEKRVVGPPADLSPAQLALRTNLALARALLFRSTSVTIEIDGNARSLVRYARLRGLICTPEQRDRRATLALSGPMALFRHTLLYGRALGEIVPLLAWCGRFRLVATCLHRGQPGRLELNAGDPIFPSVEPRRYDSRLEERFARDFRRAAPAHWRLVREPEAIPLAGGAVIFPDFAVVHASDPGRRWLLEIAGFWTPDYITRKLAQYREAALANLILCIDEERQCAAADLPHAAHVLRFRRRIDPRAILALVEGNPLGPASSRE